VSENRIAEEKGAMLFNMKEVTATGMMGDFCRQLEEKVTGGKEIIFDFKGVHDVVSADAECLMTTCLRLKEAGSVIRLKDMSLTVRNQFLMSAINYATEEIVL
jgi:MFS superfamily sulfate permease-like transporter